MRQIRLIAAVVAAAVGTTVFLAAAAPHSTAAACTLAPQLRAVTINQGDGAQARLVRGKKILVRTYWGLPTCADTANGAAIQVTGATLNAKNGSSLLRQITAPTASPLGPTFPLITVTTGSPIPADAPADVKFSIPATVTTIPSGSSSYTLTVDGSLTYQSRPNANTAFSAPATLNWATVSGSKGAITKPVEKATNALRILVVPMGGPLSATDTSILQNALSTLCRIFPVPDNSPNGSCTGDLNATAPSGGIRYAVNNGPVDLSSFASPFCGDGTNFSAIKTQLAGFLQAWNSVTSNVPADRVLGVISADPAISVGSATNSLCAEGMASVVSREAWVRLDRDKAGAVASMELMHTFGGVPSSRSDGGYHSVHTNVDWPTGDADRVFNTVTESFLPVDKSVMRFGTSSWDNSNTLLEAADYGFLLCKLGGATTSDCSTSNTAGTSVGVAAAPAVDSIVITGTTDGTVAGTEVLESYQAPTLPTPSDADSAYRLIQKNAGGTTLSDQGVRVSPDESVHVGDHDEETTTKPLFTAAVPVATGTTSFVFCKRNGSSCPTLYGRDKGTAPTITSTSSSSNFGEPQNFTNTATPNEFQPAVTKDGRWLAWMASDRIYVQPVKGGAVTAVPNPGSELSTNREPAWAPNGQDLAFVVGGEDIYKVRVGTGTNPPSFGAATLVYNGDPVEGDPPAHHPTWSGDGAKIAFEAGKDIKLISASGGAVTALTSTDDAEYPTWSQTAGDDRIAYVRRPVTTTSAEGSWVSNGPDGGDIRDLAIDPSAPSTIYAATQGGGIYKSTNSGVTWARRNSGLTRQSFDALAADPNHSGTILAGAATDVLGGAIFKSTDGGATWSESDAGLTTTQTTVRALGASPADGVFYAATDEAIYKSTDGGSTWTFSAPGDLLVGPESEFAFDPSNTNLVYVTGSSGVFRTTDGGASWGSITGGLPETGGEFGLALDPANPSVLYVAVFGSGIYKTTSGGVDGWTRVSDGISEPPYDVLVSGSTVYAATVGPTGVYSSTDGGASWAAVGGGGLLDYNAVRRLAADPSGMVFAATEGAGVFRTGGDGWSEANNGLRACLCYSVAVDPASPNVVYATNGAYGHGVYKSTDAGGTWSASEGVIPPINYTHAIAVDPVTPTTVYAGSSTGVYKSTDSGATWTEINNGLTGLPNRNIEALAIGAGETPPVYAATYDGVYKTTDGGGSWSRSSSGIPDGTAINALAASQDSTTLFAGGEDAIYRSSDGGANWTTVYSAPPVTRFVTLAIDGSTIYAGMVNGSQHFLRSIDDGATWASSSGPDGGSTIALATDPTHAGTVYAGTRTGVYKSTDTGASWNPINDGLDVRVVHGLAVDSASSRVYATTVGGGVYRLDEGGGETVEGGPDIYTLDPASPSTTQQLLLANGQYPSWGPSGTIAFARAADIWTMKSDGSSAARLVEDGFTPSIGQGLLAFGRGFGDGELFQSDIWVLKAAGEQQVEVTATGAEKADFFVKCNNVNHVLAVGVGPDEGGTFSYDADAGCEGGTISTRLNNGFSTTPVTEVGESTADTTPQKPSAAISSLPATVLQYDPIVLDGTGYDYQGWALPGSSLTWSASSLFSGTKTGNHVVLPAPANGWTPGTYTVQLSVTDGANTDSTTATVTVLADKDHDNLPAAVDKLSCQPNGASGDENPLNFTSDPDGDGKPNYADVFTAEGVCGASSSFEGSASSFSPNPFTIPPSLPTTSITGISVPFRDLAQVTGSTVKITKIDGKPVSIPNTGWVASSGLGSATFKSADLAAQFTTLGIANRSVLVTLTGSSSAFGWSFSVEASVYVKTG